MNANQLLDVIGEAHPDYLTAALATREKRLARRNVHKIALIAAIVSLMVLLLGCAVVALKMDELIIGEWKKTPAHYDEESGEIVTEPEIIRDVLSLQGIAGSPNQLAAQEWYEFDQLYDPDWTLVAEADNTGYQEPEEYNAYSVYTQEMIDKVDEICEKYGLQLAGKIAYVDPWQIDIFHDALGIESVVMEVARDVEHLGGYFYTCGNFKMECMFSLNSTEAQWEHPILLSMRYADKDYLDTVFVTVDSETAEQWNYTCSNGNDVLIVNTGERAMIFCDREDAFISVNFSSIYVGDNGVEDCMSVRDLELIAESLDFQVKPTKPDMDAVEKQLQEATAEYEATMPEREPFGYKELIVNRIEDLEHPENLYYTLIDINEDGVEDLLLGSKEKVDVIWTFLYDENSKTEHLNFVNLSDEEWAELDEAWPNMEIYPITEFPME